MLTPQSILGEVVSPRILRHTIPQRSGVDAPSCYILVTMRAACTRQVGRFAARFQAVSMAQASSVKTAWLVPPTSG